MSISSPHAAAPALDPSDRAAVDVARDPSMPRTFPGWRWVAVWLAFPLAGYIGWRVGGRVDAVDAALVGGALTGAGLGAVEWWAAKGAFGRPTAWIAGSALATSPGWRRAPRWSVTTPTSARSP